MVMVSKKKMSPSLYIDYVLVPDRMYQGVMEVLIETIFFLD